MQVLLAALGLLWPSVLGCACRLCALHWGWGCGEVSLLQVVWESVDQAVIDFAMGVFDSNSLKVLRFGFPLVILGV